MRRRIATGEVVLATVTGLTDNQSLAAMESVHVTWQLRSEKADLPIVGKPGIMPALSGLIPELATLAQSAEQTLRKRQVKGSSPLGGLVVRSRPHRSTVGAFY